MAASNNSAAQVAASMVSALVKLSIEEREEALAMALAFFDAGGSEGANTARTKREQARERMREHRANMKANKVANSPANASPSLDSPSPVSIYISSDSSPSQPASLQTDGPPSPPAIDTRPQEYRAAYERGIEQGKGSPYAMPTSQTGELHQAILAHQRDGEGKPLRGPKLLKGIEWDARQFAEFVKLQPVEKARFWNYDPRAWLRWLNTAELEDNPTPAASAPNGAPKGIVGPA